MVVLVVALVLALLVQWRREVDLRAELARSLEEVHRTRALAEAERDQAIAAEMQARKALEALDAASGETTSQGARDGSTPPP
jgi:hypothetical protein